MTASPTLPRRDDLNAEGRRQRLYATRQQYKYDRDYLAPLSMLFIPDAWPASPEEDVIGPLRDLPSAEAVKPEYLYPRWAPAFSTLESNLGRARPDPNGGLRAYEQLFPSALDPELAERRLLRVPAAQRPKSDGHPATGAGGRAPESLLGHRRPLPTRHWSAEHTR